MVEEIATKEPIDEEQVLPESDEGGDWGSVNEKKSAEEVTSGGGVRGLNKKVLVMSGVGVLSAFFLLLGIQMLGGEEAEDKGQAEESETEVAQNRGDIEDLEERASREENDRFREELLAGEGEADATDLRAAWEESEESTGSEEESEEEDPDDPWVQAREQARQRSAQAWHQEAFEAKRGSIFARVESSSMSMREQEESDPMSEMQREAAETSRLQRELLVGMRDGNVGQAGDFGGNEGGAVGGAEGEEGWEQYGGSSDWRHRSEQRLRDAPEYAVQAGTMIRLVLETAVKSDVAGLVVGRVVSPVYESVSGQFLLIPSGSKVLGEYDTGVEYGDSRVGIAWQRLILPSGQAVMLEGLPGSDEGGRAGASGTVDRRLGNVVGAAALTTALSTAAGVAAGPRSQLDTTPEQAALGSLGEELNEQGQTMVERELDVAPRIEVDAGTRLGAMVREDLMLEPYRGE